MMLVYIMWLKAASISRRSMVTGGSLMLVSGAVGLVAYLVLAALRPGLVSRRVSVAIIIVMMVLTCSGLIILTIAKGGSSLHTGG
jgi:hypothetical protein